MINLEKLQSEFPALVFEVNMPLASKTYMKVGGPAEVFVMVTKRDDLYALASYALKQSIPLTVLGGASNVIVADEGIKGLVIQNRSTDIHFTKQDETTTLVEADSGVITAVLANKTMEQGLSGLEYFIGVPGTLGGAIVNNSHYTARDLIGNFITQVEVCTALGEREVWDKRRLLFDYDYSVFHKEFGIILSATFALHPDAMEAIQERARMVAKRRIDTQPIGIPSSGCMFKNPEVTFPQLEKLRGLVEVPDSAVKQLSESRFTVAAGFLIDKAGLKGTNIGGAIVSDKHATFILNTGKATAHDVDHLASLVEAKVFEVYDLHLEREVFFLK